MPVANASSALAQHNIRNSYVIQQEQNSNQLRKLQDRYYQQQQIKRMKQQRAKEKREEGKKDGIFN